MDINELLSAYPNVPAGYSRNGNKNPTHLAGLILWLAGATSVSHGFTPQTQQPEGTLVSVEELFIVPTIIEVKPFIAVPESLACKEKEPLLWWLLYKGGITYTSGICSSLDEGYMKAISVGNSERFGEIIHTFNFVKSNS